jgi:hypothetical protein
MLPGWNQSEGAREEFKMATEVFDLEVMYGESLV